MNLLNNEETDSKGLTLKGVKRRLHAIQDNK